MKTVRLLATNTLAQLLGKVTTILSTVLIGRMISSPDGLGKAGFDEYAIIITYAAYFYIITDFGFNAIATKDITEDGQKTSSYISNVLSLRLAMSVGLIMIGLAVLAFIPAYSNAIKLGIMFMLITIVSQAIFTNGNILFQARLRYIQSTIAVIAGSLTSLSAAYIVYITGGNLYAYLFSIILGSIIMATISLVQVRASVPITLKFDWQVWRYILFAAFPLGMTIVFNLIYVRSGFFVLSIYDQDHYGIYTMAYRVFDAALVLPVFVVNALYPIMVERLQHGKQAFIKLIKKALLGMLGISLTATIAIWVIAPVAIWLSTSNQAFNESIQVLRWLSLLIPIFFLSNILLWTLISLGRRRLLILFYGVGAVISVGLNIWLIPQYGYISAIIITGIVELIITLLMAIQVWLLLQDDSTFDIKKPSSELENVEPEVINKGEADIHV